MFGNLRNNAGAPPAADAETTEVRSGRDIEVTAQLTLDEAFRGTTRTLTYGDGRKVEVTIPAGVNTGSRLRVRGQGERLMGRPLGDLYMTVEVQPHPVFMREGDDLKIRVSVPYELAMKSGEVQIPTLDHPVQLKIPAGARTGQSLRLRGQGMPSVANSSTRGDLIASIEVQAPPRTTRRHLIQTERNPDRQTTEDQAFETCDRRCQPRPRRKPSSSGAWTRLDNA